MRQMFMEEVLQELMSKKRFIVFKYPDITITQEWYESYDGEWPYGEETVKNVDYTFKFYD